MGKIAKVPQIMQMEVTECGAACLTMILAYYGKWIPLEQVRGKCGVNRDGANLKIVSKVARGYGLEPKFKAIGVKGLVKTEDVPCILYWEFDHFVVFNGIKGKYAYLNDPARGKVKLSLDVFRKKYTGVAMFLRKTEDFKPEGHQPSMVKYAALQLKGTKDSIALVMVSASAVTLAAVLHSAISGVFTDRILNGDNKDWLLPLVILLIVIALVSLVASLLNTAFIIKSEGKTAVTSSASFMWHLLHLPIQFYEQRSVGDIQKRLLDNETLTFALIGQLSPVAINIVMLLIFLYVMARYNVGLTIIGVAVALFNGLIAWRISKMRVNLARSRVSDDSKLYATTMGGIQLIKTIKSSGHERAYFEKWAGFQASVNETDVHMKLLDGRLGIIPQAAVIVANGIILAQSIFLIMKGDFTPGMSLAFMSLFTLVMDPVTQLIGLGQTIQEMRTQMERIDDVNKYPADVSETPEEEKGKEYADIRYLKGNLDLEHVIFGYSGTGEPLIDDFSLHVKPGQWVALVGMSGSGKSTLGKLISGIYPAWSGAIRFDGIPLEKIPRQVLRTSLAVVSQDIVSFHDTITDNIRFWDKSIQHFEVIMACRDAMIHDEITERSGGYNAIVDPGGSNFSGGQLQRIEIARALAQNPSILILDEATSALDAGTEEGVMKNIRALGITCIVIAHRLSTIRDCDEIIVLDGGKVVERGTHDELIAHKDAYYRLVKEE